MKYKLKSHTVDAIQFTGDNMKEVEEFVKTKIEYTDIKSIMNCYFVKVVHGNFIISTPEIFEKNYEQLWD